MDKKSIDEFLRSYSRENYSEEEHDQFIEWLQQASADEVEGVLERYLEIDCDCSEIRDLRHARLAEQIESRLDDLEADSFRRVRAAEFSRLRRVISVAAMFLVVITATIYFFKKSNVSNNDWRGQKVAAKSGILPGGNKAVLTLADHTEINLDKAGNGVLARQSGICIKKAANGELIYDASRASNGKNQKISYNTISTPVGGQFRISLPDGSKVWLNASSSLRFPTSFSEGAREVELKGEAYFEVAKDVFAKGGRLTKRPFRVISERQVVEVLGTHFNISAYPDEASTNTTLLEGQVRVSQLQRGNGKQSSGQRMNEGMSQTLRPGQQARVGKEITVRSVNVADFIAWKNGYFNFSHERIESIMKKISRWYNVDVVYRGKIPSEGFVGSVSRTESVEEVLRVLELTDAVHFKIEERRIIVMQ